MKTYIPYSLILILSILATSCEKVIDIQVHDDIDKLVIEGIINNTEAQQEIKLSKNIAFSDHNNYPAVSGAIVIVRDDEKMNMYLAKLLQAPICLKHLPEYLEKATALKFVLMKTTIRRYRRCLKW